MPTKKPTLADVTPMIQPAMLDAIDTLVVTYMAMRASVGMNEARATIASDEKVRASYERKMMRTIMMMAAGDFKLFKVQNKQPAAAPAAPDFTPAAPGFYVPGMDKAAPDAGNDHDNQDDQG